MPGKIEGTREFWLERAASALEAMLGVAGFHMPDKYRVACGFPSVGGMGKKKRRIGECWDAKCSGDGTFEILVSPTLETPLDVLATLLHEMVHAVVGIECGHKGAFKSCAKTMGLEGPMTRTTPGEELTERLHALADELPMYPHAKLDGRLRTGPKKQGTRMLKLVCPCGYTVRTTKKWIETGLPTCACGGQFVLESGEPEDDDIEGT